MAISLASSAYIWLAVALAQSLKLTRGRKLRTDGTVVETNIHHPTDSSWLNDGVRVLSRLLQRAKAFLDQEAQEAREMFRDRSRSAKRWARQIGQAAPHYPIEGPSRKYGD